MGRSDHIIMVVPLDAMIKTPSVGYAAALVRYRAKMHPATGAESLCPITSHGVTTDGRSVDRGFTLVMSISVRHVAMVKNQIDLVIDQLDITVDFGFNGVGEQDLNIGEKVEHRSCPTSDTKPAFSE